MNKNNIEKQIREDWFKGHTAVLEKLNDGVSILSWGKPNSIFYYIRYIFDGCKLYISGDVGEAIFSLTEKASLESIASYNVGYFHGKLSAFSEDKYSFDSDTAIARLKEEIEYANGDKESSPGEENEHDEEINEYISLLYKLINASRECSSKSSWGYEVQQKYDALTDYDPDVAEWIFRAGDVIPSRVEGYLIGLKMAYEQIKSQYVFQTIKDN